MNAKVVVLFGAGASYGSGGLLNPPPLGNRLFSELINKFPASWGIIDKSYRQGFEQRFENGMEQYYAHIKASASNALLPLLKDMARYFSIFGIDNMQKNLYWRLLNRYSKRLLSQEMILATINYDCLLEFAALSAGFNTFSYMGSSPGIKLLKLHGSCNFLVPMKNVNVGGNMIFIDGEVNYDINPVPISPSLANDVDSQLQNKTTLPGIVMYAKNKRLFFAAHQMRLILQEFQNVVQNASLIIIVGVKPNPADAHIWNPLINAGGQIAFIGNKRSCKQWLASNRKLKSDIWIAKRFSCGFKHICDLIDNVI